MCLYDALTAADCCCKVESSLILWQVWKQSKKPHRKFHMISRTYYNFCSFAWGKLLRWGRHFIVIYWLEAYSLCYSYMLFILSNVGSKTSERYFSIVTNWFVLLHYLATELPSKLLLVFWLFMFSLLRSRTFVLSLSTFSSPPGRDNIARRDYAMAAKVE